MSFNIRSPLHLKDYHFPNEVNCEKDVKMRSVTVDGLLSAGGSIKLSGCQISGKVFSASHVVVKRNSSLFEIDAHADVEVCDSQVSRSIFSKEGNVVLENAETGNVISSIGIISIINSKVTGQVKAANEISILLNSTISELTCRNSELKVRGCRIKSLLMTTPLNPPAQDGDLAQRLKDFKESGRIKLHPNHIIVGAKRPGRGASMSSTGLVTLESYEGFGATTNVGRDSVVMTAGDFTIRARNDREISVAIQHVLSGTVPGSCQDKGRQTVILRDSHIDKISFEIEGGVVRLVGSATVDTVEGGTVHQT